MHQLTAGGAVSTVGRVEFKFEFKVCVCQMHKKHKALLENDCQRQMCCLFTETDYIHRLQ